jgi:TPR repeat protein
MVFLARLVPTAALLALLAIPTGCRRAGPSLADDHPGIEPKPSGRFVGENLPMPDPERGVIDLSRPESKSESTGLLAADDLVYDAAIRGEAWAQTKLGQRYVTESDNAERVQLGIEFLQRAAAQRDSEAVEALARLATTGMQSQPSGITAMENLRKAAELGNADAQFELAASLANSSTSQEVTEEALNWARKAAVQGHAGAQHAVGVSLLRRAATSQDIREGLAFLERAAAQNHREALMVFAGILSRGEFGLTKDHARAEALLTPRAEGGDPQFQFGLGTLLLYSDQLIGRKDEATQWLEKSAEAGFGEARELLEKVAQSQDTPGE